MPKKLSRYTSKPNRTAWPMTLVVPYSLFVVRNRDDKGIVEYSGNGLISKREEILTGDGFILATTVTFFNQPMAMMLSDDPLVILSTEYSRLKENLNEIVIERVVDVFGSPPLVTTPNILEWARFVLNPDSLKDTGLENVGIYVGIQIERGDVERMLDAMEPMNRLLAEYHDLAYQTVERIEKSLSNRITRSAYSFGEAPTALQ